MHGMYVVSMCGSNVVIVADRHSGSREPLDHPRDLVAPAVVAKAPRVRARVAELRDVVGLGEVAAHPVEPVRVGEPRDRLVVGVGLRRRRRDERELLGRFPVVARVVPVRRIRRAVSSHASPIVSCLDRRHAGAAAADAASDARRSRVSRRRGSARARPAPPRRRPRPGRPHRRTSATGGTRYVTSAA